MVTKILHKKVELTELFYDLVFVYAISKITEILHYTTTENFLSTFGLFALVMVVFINTWMFQTVYTNRYGENSIPNLFFFMIDMAIVLFMSSNLDGFLHAFSPVTMAAGFLSITLVLQYLMANAKVKNPIDHEINQIYIYILSLRSVLLIIAALLPLKYGLIVSIVAILAGWILPAVFTKKFAGHPVNFPHLLERVTALIIVAFGETIINITPFFKLEKLTIYSVLIFSIICMLFMTYITQFDHWVDEERENESGVRLIYLHYPILFGISLVTASFNFINEPHFAPFFAISVLYVGIALFYLGVFLADAYDKQKLKKPRVVATVHVLTTVLGFGLSIIFKTVEAVVTITAIVTFINAFVSAYLMVQQTQRISKE